MELHNIPGMTSGNHQRVSTETSNTKILLYDMLHLLTDLNKQTHSIMREDSLVRTVPKGIEPQPLTEILLCLNETKM